jgi:hypothetical protein
MWIQTAIFGLPGRVFLFPVNFNEYPYVRHYSNRGGPYNLRKVRVNFFIDTVSEKKTFVLKQKV